MIPLARLQEIAELAEAVADGRCPTGQVEPASIVSALGITLSFGSYAEAFDGMLEHRKGRFHIYCNLDRVERRDSARARFTLGHELGHYFIDDHRRALENGEVPAHPSKCDYESKNPVEREADHFSSNLLMPAKRFLAQAKRAGMGLRGVLALANHFDTSITSTAIRYATLEVGPCAIMKWSDSGYAWKWLSSSTFQVGLRKTIESVSALPKGSPTAQALGDGTVPAAGFFEAGTTASAWFPHVSETSDRNAIMIEQAVRLGRFGVLSFLYPQSGRYQF